jgi:hypothetical protein
VATEPGRPDTTLPFRPAQRSLGDAVLLGLGEHRVGVDVTLGQHLVEELPGLVALGSGVGIFGTGEQTRRRDLNFTNQTTREVLTVLASWSITAVSI